MRKAGGRLNLGALAVLAVALVCATTAATLVQDIIPHERILPYTINSTGRYVYDAAKGLPYMVSELPVPAGLTITGGAIGGPLGALALGFWGALYHTCNEVEWDKVGVYEKLRDKGMFPDEAYELANKNEIHTACFSILIGILASFPAQILRFVFKRRYSLTGSVLLALLISFLSLLAQTPLLYPPYGTGTTFMLSVVTLLRPKQTALKPSKRGSNVAIESSPNEDIHRRHEEIDRQKSSVEDQAPPTPLDPSDNTALQENIILYIVSRSTSQRLSKSKLGGYLALLSRQVDLGLEITLNEYGIQIVGFQDILNRIRDAGLLSIRRVRTVSGGYRYIYGVKTKVQSESLPYELKLSIDKMIDEWDTKRSKTLLDTVVEVLGLD